MSPALDGKVMADVTRGIMDKALDHLKPQEKAIIIKLMARAAEQAYRRGFQQGAFAAQVAPANGASSLLMLCGGSG